MWKKYQQILLLGDNEINHLHIFFIFQKPCPEYDTKLWWWNSSLIALGIVEYSFINITPSSTLTQTDSTC